MILYSTFSSALAPVIHYAHASEEELNILKRNYQQVKTQTETQLSDKKLCFQTDIWLKVSRYKWLPWAKGRN